MAMLVVDGVAIQEPSELTWNRNDISSSDAGRTMDAEMHKNRITSKVTLSLAWNMVDPDQISAILHAFEPEYFNITYHDPYENATVTKTFYSGDKTAPVQIWTVNNKRYTKVSFNVIER